MMLTLDVLTACLIVTSCTTLIFGAVTWWRGERIDELLRAYRDLRSALAELHTEAGRAPKLGETPAPALANARDAAARALCRWR